MKKFLEAVIEPNDQKMQATVNLKEQTERERLQKLRSFVYQQKLKGLGKAMVEEEQIDELKKSTLASYAKKATDDVSYHSFMAGGMSAKNPERLAQDKKAIKRQTGVIKAIDRLTKEEVEQVDELDRGGILSRYINKTRNNPDRKAGNVLANKKKWGDKNYGPEEPKVKGMDRNEEAEQMDEVDYKKYLNVSQEKRP